MFGLSLEHIVILLVILIVVGPRKLPQLGNTLGRTYKNFRDALTGVEEAKFRKLDDTDSLTEGAVASAGESQSQTQGKKES